MNCERSTPGVEAVGILRPAAESAREPVCCAGGSWSHEIRIRRVPSSLTRVLAGGRLETRDVPQHKSRAGGTQTMTLREVNADLGLGVTAGETAFVPVDSENERGVEGHASQNAVSVPFRAPHDMWTGESATTQGSRTGQVASVGSTAPAGIKPGRSFSLFAVVPQADGLPRLRSGGRCLSSGRSDTPRAPGWDGGSKVSPRGFSGHKGVR